MAKGLFRLSRVWMQGRWWHGVPAGKIREDLTRLRAELRSLEKSTSGRARTVVVTSDEDYDYILVALATLMERCNLVLGSPNWGLQTQQELSHLLPTGTILHDGKWRLLHTSTVPPKQPPYQYRRPWIAIATGGSSGKFRMAVHSVQTLSAAAEAFHQFVGGGPLHNVLSLPLYHVSGWMSLWRAWCTGGVVVTKRQIYSQGLPNASSWFISIVPTQLYRELRNNNPALPYEKLRGILVGGAAVGPELCQLARQKGWPLIPVYGMTETAAMVTALPVEDFRKGIHGYGKALPHAKLELHANEGGQKEHLYVSSSSLFHGYLGEDCFRGKLFPTQDEASWSPEGSLLIAGRSDRIINTGGEKVSPEQVEWVLHQHDSIEDAGVTGVPDPEWGERVVALIHWKEGITPDHDSLLNDLRKFLAPHEVPKELFNVLKVPRNELGKLLRDNLGQMARNQEPKELFY